MNKYSNIYQMSPIWRFYSHVYFGTVWSFGRSAAIFSSGPFGRIGNKIFFATPRMLFPKGSKMHTNHQNAYIKRIPRNQMARTGLYCFCIIFNWYWSPQSISFVDLFHRILDSIIYTSDTVCHIHCKYIYCTCILSSNMATACILAGQLNDYLFMLHKGGISCPQ